MKAARIHDYGPAEVLRIEQVDRPTPGPNDVLVEVHATSINPVDWKIRSGGQRGLVRLRLPWILGLDVSGVVVEAGAQVTRFAVGDEVYASPPHQRPGTYAEYVAIDQSVAAPKPASLSHQEAAALPLVALTAWQALVVVGHLSAGERVFVQAGSGGVGSVAIQLAHHLGAQVISSCSARNIEWVQALGADEVLDYHEQDFCELLRGLDLVIDAFGGPTSWKALPALRRGGRLCSLSSGLPVFTERYGPWLGTSATIARLLAFNTWSRLRWGVRSHFVLRPSSGEQLEQITAIVEQGGLRPVIDRVLPLDEIVEAHRHSQSGRAQGKIVIAVR